MHLSALVPIARAKSCSSAIERTQTTWQHWNPKINLQISPISILNVWRHAGGAVFGHFRVFLGFLSFELQFFYKCFNKSNLVSYWFLLSLEAKTSTEVEDEASQLICLHIFMICSYNSVFYVMYVRFNSILWQNCDWLCQSWIFILFHLTDTLHLLVYFGYPLSFVQNMDTLDLLN